MATDSCSHYDDNDDCSHYDDYDDCSHYHDDYYWQRKGYDEGVGGVPDKTTEHEKKCSALCLSFASYRLRERERDEEKENESMESENESERENESLDKRKGAVMRTGDETNCNVHSHASISRNEPYLDNDENIVEYFFSSLDNFLIERGVFNFPLVTTLVFQFYLRILLLSTLVLLTSSSFVLFLLLSNCFCPSHIVIDGIFFRSSVNDRYSSGVH